MQTLVTGATGFLGAALTRQLLAQDAEVRILRRPTSRLDLLGDAARDVEHAIGDVTDPESLRKAMKGMQHVYHAAAVVYLGSSRKGERLMRANVRGAACVVDAAVACGVERMVHTSSIAALGRRPGRAAEYDEDVSWSTSSLTTPYAVSKHEAELQIHRGVAEGLDAVMVCPSVVFGPCRTGHSTMQIAELLQSRSLLAVPVGGVSVVDVEDVAAGHIRAMQRGRTGHRYILSGANMLWTEIVLALATALGVAPPRRSLPPGLALGIGLLAEIWVSLGGRNVPLSRTIARDASQVSRCSNQKSIRELGCAYRPFADTARRIAATFR